MPKGKNKPRIGKFATVITAIAAPMDGGDIPHQAQSTPDYSLEPGSAIPNVSNQEVQFLAQPGSSIQKGLSPNVLKAANDGVPPAIGKKKKRGLLAMMAGFFSCGKAMKDDLPTEQETLTNNHVESVDISQQEAAEQSGVNQQAS